MFKKVRRLFITGGTFVHNKNVICNNSSRAGPRDLLLEHASPNAIHDSKEVASQGMCLEHTREAILKLLNDYLLAGTLASPGLLWLNGAAGVGKSAVARTIAHSTSEARTLLASFFFFSSDATRNTLDPLIPTLAVQICRRFPKARPYVEQAIEDDPLIFTKETSAQADALIVQPLAQALRKTSTRPSTPLSILVDGLDECADSGKQVEVIHVLLGVIAKVHTATGIRIKVVVFSRPERWLKDRMARYEQVGQVESVTLGGDLSPRSDIKLYYAAHFAKIREDHPSGLFLEPDWPGPQQMEQLVDITDNHFAFAHTMRIFAAKPNEDPRKQLEIILGIARPTHASPHAHIDQLFATIFSRIPPHHLPLTLRIIGTFLIPSPCALLPPPPLLELLFSLRRGELQQMFFHLESLFDLGNRTSNWIRVHHKTLADFLFTPSRSKAYGLFINQDGVYEDIRRLIASVFLRQEAPERAGLAAFLQYMNMLEKSSNDAFPSQWTVDHFNSSLDDTGDILPLSMRPAPWASLVAGVYRRVPLLRSLPFLPLGVPSNIGKALSTYDSSALGRIALVLSDRSFSQMYEEYELTFHQAFTRHAIRSQPGLLEADQTFGWNLVTCNPNHLAEAAVYFFSTQVPRLRRSNLCTQAARDTFDPNWIISRLGMLCSWHESGHRSTDDPWEHAARGDVLEVANESQLQCSVCFEVLDRCKARVLGSCLSEIQPDHTFYQALFDYVQMHPLLWNNVYLFFRWTSQLDRNKELVASDPNLASIAESIRKQCTAIFEHAYIRSNHSYSNPNAKSNLTPIDTSASSKLFADAEKEERTHPSNDDSGLNSPTSTPKSSRVSVLEQQHENWTGDESIQDAVLRMLVDKYKPLRTGTIQTAEEKLKKAPPKLATPASSSLLHLEIDQRASEGSDSSPSPSPPSSGSDSSSTTHHQPRLTPSTTGSWATEPLLPSTPDHQPWHTTFKTPSVHTEAAIKAGSISSSPPRAATTPLPLDDKSRRLALENRKKAQTAGRLTKARESTLDYRLGIRGGGGVGGGRPNPVSLKGWASLVEERIEKAKQAGVFSNVKGRGKPLIRTTEETNPFIAREEFLMNRIVQRNGAAPPWVEFQSELDTAVSSFRQTLREAYIRRTLRILTLTHPAPLLQTITLTQLKSHRDPEWVSREESYHEAAIAHLNALVRKYNGLAPYAVRRPYYMRTVEVGRLYEECAEEILEKIKERGVGGMVGQGSSSGFGGDGDGGGGAGGGAGGPVDPSSTSTASPSDGASFISWIRQLFRRIFGGARRGA